MVTVVTSIKGIDRLIELQREMKRYNTARFCGNPIEFVNHNDGSVTYSVTYEYDGIVDRGAFHEMNERWYIEDLPKEEKKSFWDKILEWV